VIAIFAEKDFILYRVSLPTLIMTKSHYHYYDARVEAPWPLAKQG
jgi:hypothetical protein